MKLNSNCAFVTIFALMITSSLFGQTAEHKSHHHADSKYEIGISAGLSHLVHENETPFSAHIHLMRRLGSENVWEKVSLGAGFEYIFSKHEHYSIVGTISVNPIWHLILDVSPGILVTEHEGSKENQFVTHFELTYEFDFKDFGMGPVIGYGWSKDDTHYMIGVHIGKAF